MPAALPASILRPPAPAAQPTTLAQAGLGVDASLRPPSRSGDSATLGAAPVGRLVGEIPHDGRFATRSQGLSSNAIPTVTVTVGQAIPWEFDHYIEIDEETGVSTGRRLPATDYPVASIWTSTAPIVAGITPASTIMEREGRAIRLTIHANAIGTATLFADNLTNRGTASRRPVLIVTVLRARTEAARREETAEDLGGPRVRFSHQVFDLVAQLGLGSDQASATLAVHNIGTGSLTYRVGTPSDPRFVVHLQGGTIHAGGRFQSIGIDFFARDRSDRGRTIEATIPITTNDPRMPHFLLRVTIRVPLAPRLEVIGASRTVDRYQHEVDFGSVPVGQASRPLRVTLRNAGEGLLELDLPGWNGRRTDGGFTRSGPAGRVVLGAGEERQIVLGCHPTRSGSHFAEYTFDALEGGASPRSVDLRLRCRAEGPRLAIDGTPVAGGETHRIDLGDVPVGTYREQRVVLSNVGGGELRLELPPIQPRREPDGFRKSGATGERVLQREALAYLTFSALPTSPGIHEATYRFFMGPEDDFEVVRIALRVRAVTGSIEARHGEGDWSDEPGPLDFGQVKVGRPVLRVVEIRNPGPAPVGATLRIRMAAGAPWRFVAPGGFVRLGPGEARSIPITLESSDQGVPQLAALTIESHAPGRPQIVIPLQAAIKRPAPVLRTSAASVLFGRGRLTPRGSFAFESVLVANVGPPGSLLTLRNIAIRDGDGTFSIVGPAGAELSIPGGQSIAISLRYASRDERLRRATLTAATNDPSRSALSIALASHDPQRVIAETRSAELIAEQADIQRRIVEIEAEVADLKALLDRTETVARYKDIEFEKTNPFGKPEEEKLLRLQELIDQRARRDRISDLRRRLAALDQEVARLDARAREISRQLRLR